MINAPVGSSLIVSGISMATVKAGPTPGRTPMNVPSIVPMNPQSRFNGVNAMLKPCSNDTKVSVIGCSDDGEKKSEIRIFKSETNRGQIRQNREIAKQRFRFVSVFSSQRLNHINLFGF